MERFPISSAPRTRNRHDRHACLDRHYDRALLEPLQPPVRAARPFRVVKNDCPARIASVAFSTLATADSCALDSQNKMRAPERLADNGHLEKRLFQQHRDLRGSAPTTAGASAELVWFAANRQTPGGIRSVPRTRTFTPLPHEKHHSLHSCPINRIRILL